MREADAQVMEQPPVRGKRRWRWRIALAAAAGAALIGGSAAWIGRERIAANVIDDYLAQSGVAATYDVISIAPRQQVIANLVVGDPARPDLTARRMVIDTGVGWNGPELRRLRIEGARLFASVRGGTLSLGALDPLLATSTAGPSALPAIHVTLNDARALLDSDYGQVGLKLEGAGRLDDGFAGTLAATAPGLGVAGCRADTATAYGTITTSRGATAFDGPLRLAGLACEGASLGRADIAGRLSLARDFSAATADLGIAGERAAVAALAGEGLEGTAQINWSGERLALRHDLAITSLTAPQGRIARASAEGSWRGAANGASGQWEGTVRAAGLAPAAGLTQNLDAAARALEGSLLAPLLAKARSGLTRALTGGALHADAILRHKDSAASLIVSDASLTARSGARVLALSRVSAAIGPQGVAGLSGNILAGGEGLPSLNGRIAQAQDGGGGWSAQLAMADYAAGANRLAIPRLAVRGGADGAFAFDGIVTASGDLPGGAVTGLTVPLEGRWSAERGLALGTRCTPLRFTRLALSGLTLSGQAITLCPDSAAGAPMLAMRDNLTVAARTGPVELAGTLSESPARLAADRIVLRYPQPFAVQGLSAQIGTGTSEVRLAATRLTGSLAGDIAGAFEGGSARLAAVPFDLDAIAGRWAFADGALRLSESAFTLSDRPADGAQPRFVPLLAAGAALTLADNRITADARLGHRESGRTVADVAITHDLETAVGSARLAVPGVVFDRALQPADLSYLAQGFIALAEGTITGEGRVDWAGEKITSSGTFATEGFDFAAAFGPVRGVAGQVTFTDLLNLTTAPDQRLTIDAINPGVEVLAGTLRFDLKDGTQLALRDARFPFMGGSLIMRPLAMDFSQPEERRYTFEIIGLDAATFVAEMELGNISATGTFDGTVPIVFDADGNGRIEGGLLIARPGGGNVSYLGELAYENLGAMGNYAFSALRSLDYRQMQVGLDGDLAGEIITSFDFDGVRQGAGASRNFVTRRLAKLPIQFRVNVRSETFSQLALIARGYSDPTLWIDENLVRIENGKLILRGAQPFPAPSAAPAVPPANPPQR